MIDVYVKSHQDRVTSQRSEELRFPRPSSGPDPLHVQC
jgi:hypothetical protein